jgi:dUTP pyrophosphatase
MENNLQQMRERIFDILDPNKNYSLEDFNTEFGLSVKVKKDFNEHKIPFKFVNTSTNPNPEYATSGSSGFDLRANLPQINGITDCHITIPPGKTSIIPTGLYFEIPENFEIQIRPRSGLAAKNMVTVLNSPGTVDADYRGEIKIILINHGETPFEINHGDRIAQAVVASVINKNFINLIQTQNISDDTERSSGGFGSTGLK